MPAESLVTVVKRNEDDSEGEIYDQEKYQIRGEFLCFRLKEDPNAADSAVEVIISDLADRFRRSRRELTK